MAIPRRLSPRNKALPPLTLEITEVNESFELTTHALLVVYNYMLYNSVSADYYYSINSGL